MNTIPAAFLVVILAAAARAEPVSVVEPAECGENTYAFDSSFMSAARFKELFGLSPLQADRWSVAASLNQCIPSNPRYKPCGDWKPDSPHFFDNAEINLALLREETAKVKAIRVPAALKPAQTYALDGLAFQFWTLESQRDFVKTGNVNALKRPWRGIKPAELCAEALKKAEEARAPGDRYERAQYDWHNCVNARFQLGRAYPQKEWDAFLASGKVKTTGAVEGCD